MKEAPRSGNPSLTFIMIPGVGLLWPVSSQPSGLLWAPQPPSTGMQKTNSPVADSPWTADLKGQAGGSVACPVGGIGTCATGRALGEQRGLPGWESDEETVRQGPGHRVPVGIPLRKGT